MGKLSTFTPSALKILYSIRVENKATQMSNTFTNLNTIIDELRAAGVEPKITKLKTRKARKADLVFTSGHRTTGVRAAGVKIRGGNGHNAGGKVG